MERMALRRILAALCCLALFPVAGCAGGQDVLLADKDGAQAICLDYGWRVHADEQQVGEEQAWYNGFPDEGIETKVPGETSALGRHSVIWYENRFTPDLEAEKGQRIYAEFEGTTYYSKVWLNGQYLGDHEGDHAKFKFDITELLKAGEENLLAVRMYSPAGDDEFNGLTSDQLPTWAGQFQKMQQPVYITVKPDVRIDNVFVNPDCGSGKLKIDVTLENPTNRSATVAIAASVSPAEKSVTLDSALVEVRAAKGESTHSFELEVDHFTYWDIDNPYLYSVEVVTKAGNSRYADSASVTTGFKTFEVDDDGYFRLNGERLFVKCAHTVPYFPGALDAPSNLELMYKELRYLKASGYNMVRFLSSPALPQQLDYCDRIGLMVYEESHMSWQQKDHEKTEEYFKRDVEVIVERDRNHPSLAVFGMLNETLCTGATEVRFNAAVDALQNVRALAPNLYVELSSGRWDGMQNIGSGSNPGSMEWDAYMGDEDPSIQVEEPPAAQSADALFPYMGDVHYYPRMPYNAAVRDVIQSLGGKRATFLSEAGAGSQANIISEYLLYAQNDLPLNLYEHTYLTNQYNDLLVMFDEYKMDRVFGSPEEMIQASQEVSARQRSLLLDMVRSNPKINGYSMTMATDITYRGEGVIEGWANYKKGMTDALSDGWEDLRWCINFEKAHIYADEPIQFTVDLSDIGVLKDQDYPARIRIRGEQGTVWDKEVTIRPVFDEQGNSSYVIPVLDESLELNLPSGAYTVSATMLQGAHPTCGERTFYVTNQADFPSIAKDVYYRGLPPSTVELLEAHGANMIELDEDNLPDGSTVLLGGSSTSEEVLEKLFASAERGSHIIGLSRTAFGYWGTLNLPIEQTGSHKEMDNWLYHFDSLVYENKLTEGLTAGDIMEPEYFESVMSKYYIANITPPDDPAFTNFFIGFDGGPGIDLRGGVQLGTYSHGEGFITVNALSIMESIGTPVADRLLFNMVSYID